jgi:hypothetical protein
MITKVMKWLWALRSLNLRRHSVASAFQKNYDAKDTAHREPE